MRVDIWAWVEELYPLLRQRGLGRLADLMEQVPDESIGGDRGRLEALVDEGVALARDAGLPWVEVFLRHWRLQRRVLKDLDVSGDTLTEAVRLYEFAHRDETRDCPQSVCSAQDICEALLLQDGPGNAERCLEAAEETLGRIELQRACYGCVGAAKAESLMHLGRTEEARGFAMATAKARGEARSCTQLLLRARAACMELGDFEEALRITRLPSQFGSGEAPGTVAVYEAHALAALARVDEARHTLPAPNGVVTGCAASYLATASLIVRHGGTIGDVVEVERFASRQGMTIERHGARWEALEVALHAAECAMHRGAWVACRYHVQVAERRVGQVAKPELRRARLVALREWLAANPPVALGAAAALAATVGLDAAAALEVLEPAYQHEASHPGLGSAVFRACMDTDRTDGALEVALSGLAEDALAWRQRALEAAHATGSADVVESLMTAPDVDPTDAEWAVLRAGHAASRGDRSLAAAILRAAPQTRMVRARAMDLALQHADLDAAMDLVGTLRELDDSTLARLVTATHGTAHGQAPAALALERGLLPAEGEITPVEVHSAGRTELVHATYLGDLRAQVIAEPNWASARLAGWVAELTLESGLAGTYLRASGERAPSRPAAVVEGLLRAADVTAFEEHMQRAAGVVIRSTPGVATDEAAPVTLLVAGAPSQTAVELQAAIAAWATETKAEAVWPDLAELVGEYHLCDTQFDRAGRLGYLDLEPPPPLDASTP